jgi:pimeloyl-ACP methyl ester carboxylesterase
MAKSTRLLKSFYRLLLPVIFLVVVSGGAAGVWLAYESSRPWPTAYLVTPEKYGMISARAAQVTEETWSNRDGSTARGWLLRGSENSPAVILFHKYGADRSHLLNLGVKLNEATNFTILMPDLRGHGESRPVPHTSFGGCESADAAAAIDFLRSQKTAEQTALVGEDIGLYGLELGSLVALSTAAENPSIKAVVVDSVPADSDRLIASVIGKRYPFGSVVTAKLGQWGTQPYFYDGCYSRVTACDLARQFYNRSALLLAGVDAPEFQESTNKLSKCFPSSARMQSETGLSPSGYSIINASLAVSEAYDQRVIDFFRTSLGAPTMVAEVPEP